MPFDLLRFTSMLILLKAVMLLIANFVIAPPTGTAMILIPFLAAMIESTQVYRKTGAILSGKRGWYAALVMLGINTAVGVGELFLFRNHAVVQEMFATVPADFLMVFGGVVLFLILLVLRLGLFWGARSAQRQAHDQS